MSNTDFDIAEFQAKVIASIHELQMLGGSTGGSSARRSSASSEGVSRVSASKGDEGDEGLDLGRDMQLNRRLREAEAELARLRSIEAMKAKREKEALEKQKRMEEAEKSLGQATELIKQRSIRTTLCPALKSISNDVFDISKVVTPLLVGASLAGTIVMPLNPLLFAGISLVIARMGISSICAGYDDEKKKHGSQ